MPIYRHRQSSLLIPVLVLVPSLAAIAVAAWVDVRRPVALATLAVAAIAVVFLAIGCSSLTVEVGEDELLWFFGPGVWRKQIIRRDIASVAPVRNPWWYGFGIHLTPRGWLYNIEGLDAVEISLLNGRTLRIGTDEPRALTAALRRRDAR